VTLPACRRRPFSSMYPTTTFSQKRNSATSKLKIFRLRSRPHPHAHAPAGMPFDERDWVVFGAFRLSVCTDNFTLNLGWRYRNGGENPHPSAFFSCVRLSSESAREVGCFHVAGSHQGTWLFGRSRIALFKPPTIKARVRLSFYLFDEISFRVANRFGLTAGDSPYVLALAERRPDDHQPA
jgi:hypothetical protein